MHIRILFVLLLAGCASLTGRDSVFRPVMLQCEYRVDPMGIDVKQPRLSWILESGERGQKQTAYRILVAASLDELEENRGGFWDSGKVDSGRQLHVVYDGKPLASRTACWWKVRAWDRDGEPSPWSLPARFTLGLIEKKDWSAEWIGLPAPLEKEDENPMLMKWLWHPGAATDDGKAFFRRDLDVGDSCSQVVLEITADDSYLLYINGEQIKKDGNWRTIERFELKPGEQIKRGRNVIAVEAVNSEGPCGFICGIMVEGQDGAALLDGTEWVCTDSAEKSWFAPDAQPTGWVKPKVLAEYGAEPWGTLSRGLRPAQPAVMLRKGFDLEEKVARATLYATARGVYQARINGKPVGDQVLAPEWTEYNKRVQVQTHDVTGLLKKGDNAIAVLLGEGWYAGRMGFEDWPDVYGENPQFLLQLEVELEGGRKAVITSDGSWRGTVEGPVRASGIYDGETIDARLRMAGWDNPGFDDKEWQSKWHPVEAAPLDETRLVWQRSQPIGVIEELEPVRLTEPSPGVHVFDFGQNMVGFCRLKARGPEGATITVRHAERLDENGNLYTANLRAAKATDTYILSGSKEDVFEPHFTYHGFRYVEVTGLEEPPELGDLIGLPFCTRAPEVFRFKCSSPLVNRLMQNILWGLRGNLTGVPTDCPQRDERLGWTGDVLAFSQTATFNMDLAAFFAKYSQDLRDAQSEDGQFPDFAPKGPARNMDRFGGVPAWGDAGIVIPWRVYQNYGDQRLLEEHYASAEKWIAYIQGENPDLLWTKGRHNDYGDWVNGDTVRLEEFPNKGNNLPKEVFATAFFANSVRIVSSMAKVLGRMEDVKRYDELFERIKTAFNEAYVEKDGRIQGDTQAGYALALNMDLLEEPIRPLAVKHLLEAIERYKGHLSTGFHTAYRLMLELSRESTLR